MIYEPEQHTRAMLPDDLEPEPLLKPYPGEAVKLETLKPVSAVALLPPVEQPRRNRRLLLFAGLVLTLLLTALLSFGVGMWWNSFNQSHAATQAIGLSQWIPPAPVTIDSTWFGYYHDLGNTGASKQTLVPPLHEVWHSSLTPRSSMGFYSMSIANGKLLVSKVDSVEMFATSDGHRLLQQDMADSQGSGTTLSPDGKSIYYLSRFDFSKYDAGGSNQSSIRKNYFTSYSVETGKIMWQHYSGADTLFAADDMHNRIILAYTDVGATANDTTYIAVEALDPQTGISIWRNQVIPYSNAASARLAVAGDTAYVYYNGGTLTALDIASGAIRWKQKKEVGEITLLADAQQVVQVGSEGMLVYPAVGLSQAADIQSYQGGASKNIIEDGVGYTSADWPAVMADGNLYLVVKSAANASAQGYHSNVGGWRVISLDKTGAVRWLSSERFSYSVTGMIASNGLFFVEAQTTDTRRVTYLLAFSMNDGRMVWQSPAISQPAALVSAPIIGDGLLYLTYDGEVHAFAGVQP